MLTVRGGRWERHSVSCRFGVTCWNGIWFRAAPGCLAGTAFGFVTRIDDRSDGTKQDSVPTDGSRAERKGIAFQTAQKSGTKRNLVLAKVWSRICRTDFRKASAIWRVCRLHGALQIVSGHHARLSTAEGGRHRGRRYHVAHCTSYHLGDVCTWRCWRSPVPFARFLARATSRLVPR